MSALIQTTDSALLLQIQQGEQNAFAEIYERYWGQLYIHAIKLLKDEDEAKDVIQDVFTSLWKQAPALNIHTALSSYLFSAVRNRVLNIVRDNRTYDHYIDLFSLYVSQHHSDILDKINEKELAAAIELVIQSLPEKMRAVFELSRKQHLTHKEIAAELNISEGTVKRQISNALQLLRTRLNKNEGLLSLAILFLLKRP